MNPINLKLLESLRDLILMAESMGGCEGKLWNNAKKVVREAEDELEEPSIPQPARSVRYFKSNLLFRKFTMDYGFVRSDSKPAWTLSPVSIADMTNLGYCEITAEEGEP